MKRDVQKPPTDLSTTCGKRAVMFFVDTHLTIDFFTENQKRPIYTSLSTDTTSKETCSHEKRRINITYIPEHRMLLEGCDVSVDTNLFAMCPLTQTKRDV